MSQIQRLVLTALVLSGVPSGAAARSKVLLVPFAGVEGASDAAAAKFSGLVGDELKNRVELQVVTRPSPPEPTAARAEKAEAPRTQPTAEATRAMHAGRAAFDELRFEDAAGELRRGIEGMLQDPATADYDNVEDAFLKLATAHFRVGHEKEARNTLLDLVRFSPKLELPAGYPPVFQREFERARERMDKYPRGQVSVEGPPGATAFIDGRDLGMVPVVEDNVPAGLHYVKVEGTRGERFGSIVEVKGGVARVKATFSQSAAEAAGRSPTSDQAVGPLVDGVTQEHLAGLATGAGADFALIGVVSRVSDLQLAVGGAVFQLRTRTFAALPRQVFDAEVASARPQAVKLVEDLVKRTQVFEPSSPLPLALLKDVRVLPSESGGAQGGGATHTPALVMTESPVSSDGPVESVAKKSKVPAWVWVAAGVAVAGAAVGGYFGYTALTKPVTGTVVATW